MLNTCKKNFLFFFLLLITVLGSISLSANNDRTADAKDYEKIAAEIAAKIDAKKESTKKICLTMIVKNESRIIERCLNSVKDIVDYISICDTGSTDNTVAIIEAFMKNNHIPGKVHHHEWKNFGHNRSLSVQESQKMLSDLSVSLHSCYLLLLDADMLLEIDPSFKKETLNADSLLLIQKTHWMTYYNTRLIKASQPWKCIGVTHEYWGCDENTSSDKLETLVIDDREDGGAKADKFERDIRLLTQGLKDEPDNVRYMFYLAQSYKCIHAYEDSIRWYKARIKAGGWKEEVWYSKCMIGEMYEAMEQWDNALHWYLDAFQTNPDRAEPLQKIATKYRMDGQHHLAYLFAKQGSRIPFPKDQILFIIHPVYDYMLDDEIAIVGWYIPSAREEGFVLADRLALKTNIPKHVKEHSYRNLTYYAKPLQNAQFEPLSFTDQNRKKESKKLIYEIPGYDLSRFKEIVSPISFDDGYLSIICESVQKNNENDIHELHRFVYTDKGGRIARISRPFTFKNNRKESCLDMSLSDNKENIILWVNTDNTDWMCSIESKTVRSLLQPMP